MATIDERIEKLEEKKEQLNQQVKQLKARKSQEERKARTKRLIEIGAAVESVLNRPIEHDELPKLIDFLKTQEQRGHFFSKAMNKQSENKIKVLQGESLKVLFINLIRLLVVDLLDFTNQKTMY